jgi:ABC-type uncharacterized transport system fused permease/ATPase subunit
MSSLSVKAAREKRCSSARSSGSGPRKRPETRPARQSIAFIPTHAYIPPGVLRSSITYPRAADAANDAAIEKALADVGLDRLKPMLGKVGRWDRELNDDEKQRIALLASSCKGRDGW